MESKLDSNPNSVGIEPSRGLLLNDNFSKFENTEILEAIVPWILLALKDISVMKLMLLQLIPYQAHQGSSKLSHSLLSIQLSPNVAS